MTHAIRPVDFDNLKTMTYEVTDRVARITFNRPDKGNAIVADTPLELSALVERADLDPNVHVILVSGRGEGFCAGFDLCAYADRTGSAGGKGTLSRHRAGRQDPGGQPSAEPAVGPDDRLPDDESLRARLLQPDARGQADGGQDPRLLRGRRHRYRVARRSGDRRRRRQDRLPADPGVGRPGGRPVGAPPRRPRAKRLLFTGDCITGAQAAEWGWAVEAPDPADLDERTERLVERIAAVPVNQLIMVKLALNSALLQQGVATSRMVSTVFDGVARHTPEGHAFVADAVEHGFREAVGIATNRSATTAAELQSVTMPDRPMTARSVVLSVLLGAHPAWARAGELIRLTADFGIKESTLRVALTRMVSAGDLVRSADGYRLSDRLLARQRRQDDAMRPATAALERKLVDADRDQRRQRRAHPGCTANHAAPQAFR